MKSKFLYAIVSILFITSCGGGGGGGVTPPALVAAIINSFTSSSSSIIVGSTVDISWSSSNASSCSASGAWEGTRDTSGSETVTIDTALL